MKFKHIDELEGCIFDLDGTLLDSMHIWQELDRKYLERFNIVFDPIYSEEIKRLTFDESAKYFIGKFNIPKSESEIKKEWYEMIEVEYEKHIPLKPNAIAFLELLKQRGIRLCVATSCHKPHAELALKRLGIYDYFSFICTSKEIGLNKHHPDIFLQCAHRLQVAVHKCAVFEDLQIALKVCHEAGFICVGVHDVLSAHDKDEMLQYTDYYIEDFSSLID